MLAGRLQARVADGAERGADDADRAVGPLRIDADLILFVALAESGFEGSAVGDRFTSELTHEGRRRLRPRGRELPVACATAEPAHSPAARVRDGRTVAFHEQQEVRQRVEELRVRHSLTVLSTAAPVVDARHCAADDGRTLGVINPATEEVLNEVAYGGRAETKRAIEAAHKALPGWRKLTAWDRAKVLDGLERACYKRPGHRPHWRGSRRA